MKLIPQSLFAALLLTGCATNSGSIDIKDKAAFTFKPFHQLGKNYLDGKKIYVDVSDVNKKATKLMLSTYKEKVVQIMRVKSLNITENINESDIIIDLIYNMTENGKKIGTGNYVYYVDGWSFRIDMLDTNKLREKQNGADVNFTVFNSTGKSLTPQGIDFSAIIGHYIGWISEDFFSESGVNRRKDFNQKILRN